MDDRDGGQRGFPSTPFSPWSQSRSLSARHESSRWQTSLCRCDKRHRWDPRGVSQGSSVSSPRFGGKSRHVGVRACVQQDMCVLCEGWGSVFLGGRSLWFPVLSLQPSQGRSWRAGRLPVLLKGHQPNLRKASGFFRRLLPSPEPGPPGGRTWQREACARQGVKQEGRWAAGGLRPWPWPQTHPGL